MKRYLAIFMFFFLVSWAGSFQKIKDFKTLHITSPKSGEKFSTTDMLPIAWKAVGISGQIKIVLIRADKSKTFFLKETHDIKNSPYHHPLSKIPPSEYFLRIKHFKTKIIAKSEKFKVTRTKLTPPAIEVTHPKNRKKFTKGDTTSIRWITTLKHPFKHELYDHTGTTKIRDCETYTLHEGISAPNKYRIGWKIPKDVPPTSYTIRVSKGSMYGTSPVFFIQEKGKTIVQTLTPNISTRKSHKTEEYSWMGSLPEHGSGHESEKRPGMTRVGFENGYRESGLEWFYSGWVFRTKLVFNFSEFEGKRVLVKKAKLILKRDWDCLGRNCARTICVLTGPWTRAQGTALLTPGYAYASLPPATSPLVQDDGTTISIDLRSVVERWISGAQSNYGVLLTACNESFDHDNTTYVTYHWPKLEIELYQIGEE